ncbi:MAG: hypothetical protein WBM02_06270 [bacterium]
MKTTFKYFIVLMAIQIMVSTSTAQSDPEVIDDVNEQSISLDPDAEIVDDNLLEGSLPDNMQQEQPSITEKQQVTTQDDVGFISSVIIHKGETRDDDLVVFGGKAIIDGTLMGDLVVLGGGVTLSGTVKGDAIVIGGKAHLLSGSTIMGDIVAIGSRVERDPEAEVMGDSVLIGEGGLTIGAESFSPKRWLVKTGYRLSVLVTWLFISFLTALLFSKSIENTAETAAERPAQSALAGFLFHVGTLLVCLLLTVTVIGIPLAIIGVFLWIITGIFGTTAGFVLMGKLIMKNFRDDYSRLLVLFIVGFLVLAIIRQVPWLIGWSIWQIWGMVGIGAAMLSRFGTNRPWFGNGRKTINA